MWLLLLFSAKPHPGEITLASKCGPYTLWALANDVDVYILTSSMIMISWRKFSGQHLKSSEVDADFTEKSQKDLRLCFCIWGWFWCGHGSHSSVYISRFHSIHIAVISHLPSSGSWWPNHWTPIYEMSQILAFSILSVLSKTNKHQQWRVNLFFINNVMIS